MSKRYRVNADFRMIGGFWSPDQPNDTFTGTLTSRRGAVEILGAPTYSKFDGSTASARIRAILQPDPPQRIPSLLGFTTDKRCSLFGSTLLNQNGLVDTDSRQEVSAKHYKASRTVMGLHLESADAPVVDGAAFHFSKIHQILPRTLDLQMEVDKTVYTVPTVLQEIFKFASTELDAEVTCEVYAGGNSKVRGDTRIRPAARIKIMPRHQQSVDWLTAIAFRIESFFTLLMGTSVELKQVQLFQNDDIGWLIQKVRRAPEKVNFQMWANCSYSIIAAALEKWLGVPEDKRPVELTLLQILRKSQMFDETTFLSLAQALEGFGRISFYFGKGKQSTFAEYLRKTIALLTEDFAKELLGDPGKLTEKLVQTRNYYTHLGNVKKSAVAKPGSELFLLNKLLSAFLRCVMLIDLGVPEDALRQPILYQSKRWRIV